jgi:NDP-sugar pyrophosphorylase family protein
MIRAIILAAGKGERLKEITENIPKPMIIFRGKPILQHNIELCRSFGIKDIFINLYHLPEKITDYFGNGGKFGVNIKYSYEKELLGTAGAVKKIVNEFFIPPVSWRSHPYGNSPGEAIPTGGPLAKPSPREVPESFFVLYGDNYSRYNLNLLKEKQLETDSSCIIAFHYREDTSHSGVAESDKSGRVLRFIEKPKAGETESHWVNAGIYLLKPGIINYIDEVNSDFGKNIFPLMLNKNIPVYGICENSAVIAFDDPEMYKNSFSKRAE